MDAVRFAAGDPVAGWVPDACTLPTIEQPVRLAEFDRLLVAGVTGQARLSAVRLRWALRPDAEAAARELTRRESACCSFFTFAFAHEPDGELALEVTVPTTHADVLEGLAQWAETLLNQAPPAD